MAGRGPAPKDPDKRIRRNKDVIPGARVVEMRPGDVSSVSRVGRRRQLPADILQDGETWHPATKRWWAAWASSPLMDGMPETDWMELQACALMHHQLMTKRHFTLAAELRQRMAKFGATPEDRARLRIQLVTADSAEKKADAQTPKPLDAGTRHGDIRLSS